jgi:phenylacetate-CoA ligase
MNKHIFKLGFYAKYNILKSKLIKNIETAWNNQYLSEKELEKIQLVKIKILLSHAYDNTVFYKRKFEQAGFHPDTFHDLKDIEQIPVLTKDKIRECLNNFLATNLESSRRETVNTGGTTGIPMKFFRDVASKDWMTALYFRTIK